MSATLIMVWIGSAANLEAHQADLDGWAASREVRIEEPAQEPDLPPARHDDALAERVEALLGEAQAAAFSAESGAAGAALDTAERLVLSSPDLPEAPWLMAEVYRARAALVAASDPAAARELEQRAVALSGPRAASFAARERVVPTGKKALDVAPDPASAPPASDVVRLEGPLPTDDVAIDGIGVAYPRTIPDGSHHVRVVRGGRLAWTGFVTVNGTDVHVAVPEQRACSAVDLASAGGQRGVLCESYARARPVAAERIEVSLCHRSSCGPWLPWSRAWGATFEGPVHSGHRARPSHAWLPWTLGGVAAVLIGGFVLVETGAFERRGSTRESFDFVPPK